MSELRINYGQRKSVSDHLMVVFSAINAMAYGALLSYLYSAHSEAGDMQLGAAKLGLWVALTVFCLATLFFLSRVFGPGKASPGKLTLTDKGVTVPGTMLTCWRDVTLEWHEVEAVKRVEMPSHMSTLCIYGKEKARAAVVHCELTPSDHTFDEITAYAMKATSRPAAKLS